jgi:di/tricarboxylate transporter
LPCLLTQVSAPSAILPLAFSVYIASNVQYLFPFHNTVIMLGMGIEGGFSTKQVAKFGAYMIFVLFIAMALFYIPWWKLIGLI